MNRKVQREKFIDMMAKFIAYTDKHLPDDVYTKLRVLSVKENTILVEEICKHVEYLG